MLKRKQLVCSAMVLLGMLLIGCGREKSTMLKIEAFDPNLQSMGAIKGNQKDVFFECVLGGDLGKGELLLVMNIENGRDEAITVDYGLCNLWIDADRVAVADPQGEFQVLLAPGDAQQYVIRFRPINSVDFYNSTGYPGNMKATYGLTFDFIKDNNGNPLIDEVANFEFPNDVYQPYLANAREKNIRIFDFDFDSDQFAKDQHAYFKKHSSEDANDHEVFAITPSISIDRVITNFRTFMEEDTLTVDMRLLNESSLSFYVIPKGCTIKTSTGIVQPVVHYSDSFENHRIDSVYTFKPGTRLHLSLKYFIEEKIEQWKLSSNWLQIVGDARSRSGSTMPFFHSDIPFKESLITKKKI